MNKLTELGIKHNTDKAYYHGFTDVYEPYFSKYENPSIFEIGTYNGGSIKMMDEYFGGYCDIVGFDRGDQLAYRSEKSNITLVLGDQSIEADLVRGADTLKQYDIIIDDGSHFVEHQQFSFNILFPYLKSGGIYIIEDLHSSLHDHYNPNKSVITLEWLKDLKSRVDSISGVNVVRTRSKSEAWTHEDSITSVITKK